MGLVQLSAHVLHAPHSAGYLRGRVCVYWCSYFKHVLQAPHPVGHLRGRVCVCECVRALVSVLLFKGM